MSQDTMYRENWLNIVVFFPKESWERILKAFYEEFQSNEFLHHEVRGVENRGVAIDIRLYCKDIRKEIHQKASHFFSSLGLASSHYRFDPKAKDDTDFSRYSGFISKNTDIHTIWTRTRVSGYNIASKAAVAALSNYTNIEDQKEKALMKGELVHLFSWMLGFKDIPVLGMSGEKQVIAVCYEDRVSGTQCFYNPIEIIKPEETPEKKRTKTPQK
ncbi:MAG: hypothetical protein ACFFDV_12020 [Candidatus Thorarchaeota archaeon]